MSNDALVRRLLEEGYANEAYLAGAAWQAAIDSRRHFDYHVIISGDSVSLPRPIRYDEHRAENPFLASRYVETFGPVFTSLLEQRLGRKVWLTDASTRGARWQDFEGGIGRGLIEMLTSLEADVFVPAFGTAEIWHADRPIPVQDIASRYAALIETISKRLPLMKIILFGCTILARRLQGPHSEIVSALRRFNSELSDWASSKDNIAFVDSPTDENKWLHQDGWHLSTAGHAEVAKRLLRAYDDLPKAGKDVESEGSRRRSVL